MRISNKRRKKINKKKSVFHLISKFLLKKFDRCEKGLGKKKSVFIAIAAPLLEAILKNVEDVRCVNVRMLIV